MLTEPGTYYLSQPYPGNTQINVKEFDGTETFIVIENKMIKWTLYILKSLGYKMDTSAQIGWENYR